MANSSISGLAAGSTVAATDIFPDVQTAGVGPVKVTAAQIATYVYANLTLTVGTTATSGGAAGQLMLDTGSVLTESPTLTYSASTTGSSTAANFTIAPTWTTTGKVDAALKVNVSSDTGPSASGSRLLDLQYGGVSKVFVDKVGTVYVENTIQVDPNTTGTGGLSLKNYLDNAEISLTSAPDIRMYSTTGVIFYNSNGAISFVLTPVANFVAQIGGLDAAAPNAQTFQAQSVVAGTSNTAGPTFTIAGAKSTGSGGGDFQLQTTLSSAGATAQNTLARAILMKGGTQSVAIGSASMTTSATGGFAYIPAAAGTPTGVPETISGFVPMYLDTTNSQLWLYLGGAWKQPKTPSGAALVTWQ